jgi:hypothetical protein
VDALVSQVLDPLARTALDPAFLERVRTVLALVLREAYLVPTVCAAAGFLLVVLKFPRGSVRQLAAVPASVGE